MLTHLRKLVAQVGVILYVSSLAAPAVPYIWNTAFPLSLTLLSGLVLFVAALLPTTSDESWGSMSPLVGYDNVIDSLYVRGPWLRRFEELDEAEAEKRTRTAMSRWF